MQSKRGACLQKVVGVDETRKGGSSVFSSVLSLVRMFLVRRQWQVAVFLVGCIETMPGD